jgi:hypothetical protein
VVIEPRWQEVLYGRTVRADRWWRVRPRLPDAGWLNTVITAAVAGGEGLAAEPRFLLARRGDALLAGAATQADRISGTMNSDGTRPLYCFVGWLSLDREATVPELSVVEQHWTTWAGEVYESWMRLDWRRHPAALADAHEPPLKTAPWQGWPESGENPESEPARTWRDLLGRREDFVLETSSLSTRIVDTHENTPPAGEEKPVPAPPTGPEPERGTRTLPGIFPFGKRKVAKERDRTPPATGPGGDLTYWAGSKHPGDPDRPERRSGR